MTRLFTKMLSAEIDTTGGERTIDFLRYVTPDDGIFGRSTKTAFLTDVRSNKPSSPNWADALLNAERGVVTTNRRQTFPVTFRLADQDEHGQAMAQINEIRPIYGTRTDPDDVRVILVEIDDTLKGQD